MIWGICQPSYLGEQLMSEPCVNRYDVSRIVQMRWALLFGYDSHLWMVRMLLLAFVGFCRLVGYSPWLVRSWMLIGFAFCGLCRLSMSDGFGYWWWATKMGIGASDEPIDSRMSKGYARVTEPTLDWCRCGNLRLSTDFSATGSLTVG